MFVHVAAGSSTSGGLERERQPYRGSIPVDRRVVDATEDTALCKVTSCGCWFFPFPFPNLPAGRGTVDRQRGTGHVNPDRHYEQDARNKLLHRILCT